MAEVVTTVADAMLRHPTVHPADLTVGKARAVFEASPKTRLLLLVADGVLVSTLTRDDLEAADDPTTPAAGLGTLEDRCVSPDLPLDPTREALVREGRPRLAVVAEDGRLLGLLCLKRSQSGFCTDDGVAQMRRSRQKE
jgi:CBS domain-containing protein